MVEYTAVNYVLLSASIVLFVTIAIGIVILVIREGLRKKKMAKLRKEEIRIVQRHLDGWERPPSRSTMASHTVSLKGINEWHILPPIRHSFQGYTVDSDSVGYSTTYA